MSARCLPPVPRPTWTGAAAPTPRHALMEREIATPTLTACPVTAPTTSARPTESAGASTCAKLPVAPPPTWTGAAAPGPRPAPTERETATPTRTACPETAPTTSARPTESPTASTCARLTALRPTWTGAAAPTPRPAPPAWETATPTPTASLATAPTTLASTTEFPTASMFAKWPSPVPRPTWTGAAAPTPRPAPTAKETATPTLTACPALLARTTLARPTESAGVSMFARPLAALRPTWTGAAAPTPRPALTERETVTPTRIASLVTAPTTSARTTEFPTASTSARPVARP